MARPRVDNPQSPDATLKVPRPVLELVRRIAAVEQRNHRTVVMRALDEYARKHAPKTLEAA